MGRRRGLVAFRILGYRIDAQQPYPYLPRLTIEIVDPATINLDEVAPGGTTTIYLAGTVQNVRLVR